MSNIIFTEMPECRMMSRLLKSLNKEWKNLPNLSLVFGTPYEGCYATYDHYDLVIEIPEYYLTKEKLSQQFWKLVILHEFRHHIQFYDECFDLKTLSRYCNWKKEYVLLEWDADCWAYSEYFAKYAKGTENDLHAVQDFFQTKDEIAHKFSRRSYGQQKTARNI